MLSLHLSLSLHIFLFILIYYTFLSSTTHPQTKRFTEAHSASISAAFESITGKPLDLSVEAGELQMVRSGLLDSLSNAYAQVHKTAEEKVYSFSFDFLLMIIVF